MDQAIVLLMAVVLSVALVIIGISIYSMAREKSEANMTAAPTSLKVGEIEEEVRFEPGEFVYEFKIPFEIEGKGLYIPVGRFKDKFFRCKNLEVARAEGKSRFVCEAEVRTGFMPSVPCRRSLAVGQTMVCNGVSVTLIGIYDKSRLASEMSKSIWVKLADLTGLPSKFLSRKKGKFLVVMRVSDGRTEAPVAIHLDKGCRQAEGRFARIYMLSKDGKIREHSGEAEMGGCYGKEGCTYDADETCDIEMAGGGDFENGLETVDLMGNKVHIRINSIIYMKNFASYFDSYILGIGEPFFAAIEDMDVIGEGELEGVKSPLEIYLYPSSCLFLRGAWESSLIKDAVHRCGLSPAAVAKSFVLDDAEELGFSIPKVVG